MPIQVRKLTADEIAREFPRRGQMDLSEYTQALRGLRPGDAAEIELGGLSARAVKRRTGQAARQLGFSLRWAAETGGNRLRFLVRPARQQRAGAAPKTGRRGRPRKERT